MQKKLSVWMSLVGLWAGGSALALGAAAAAVPHDGTSPKAAPSSAKPRPAQPGMVTVNGEGGGTLTLPAFKGDVVSFRIRASAPATTPWAADGTVEVTHVRPDGTVLADFGVSVDCLMAGSDIAVVTGTISRGGAVELPGEELGHRVGLTIADQGRRDHLGWSWWVMGFHDTPPCTSIAPVFPITDGDFRVDTPPRPGHPRPAQLG